MYMHTHTYGCAHWFCCRHSLMTYTHTIVIWYHRLLKCATSAYARSGAILLRVRYVCV